MEYVGIAADHGGFELKGYLIGKLKEKGFEVLDFGNNTTDVNDDYPDYVIPLARAIGKKEISKGIAVCGSGVGACVAANKIKGVRACLIAETYSAHQGVEHDDMNLICLGGRVLGTQLAEEIVNSFLAARYSGKERHQRRLDKIALLEENMV
jgi:ribose 5-phosphate isomerase B